MVMRMGTAEAGGHTPTCTSAHRSAAATSHHYLLWQPTWRRCWAYQRLDCRGSPEAEWSCHGSLWLLLGDDHSNQGTPGL